MKIVHVSQYDSNGGADRAAYRLHTGLRRLAYDSVLFVSQRLSDDPSIVELSRAASWPSRIVRRLRRERIRRDAARYPDPRAAGHEMISDDRSEYRSDVLRQIPACDVVNLHWIAGFLDHRYFFARMPRRVPVVWTLHDMNAFTGGCYYDEGCGRYTVACGECPQLGSQDDRDLSRQIWRRKRMALESIPLGGLYLVANSRWLAAEAARSSLMGNLPITVIHYGLDVEVFAPRDRLHARSVLGVPADAAVLLFGAASVENRRKGFGLLGEALAGLSRFSNLVLVTFGRGTPKLPCDVPHIHFGRVEADRFLCVLYSAADVFVMPSLQEAFGQTVLEAMACGTPVIAFAVGGIREIVQNGITGCLVNPADAGALREAICGLLQDPSKRAEMSVNCRRIVLERYTLEVQARRYAELYERILHV
jgi:glycosyltransferase involved in cell wall biosynthesis